MKSKTFNVGEKFIKLGDPKTVWVVRQVKEFPGLPPHAELQALGYRNRTTLMAQEALANHRMYRRIENT